MALETGTDGSEDVSDFLARVRELGQKRDKEDEERTRKLEEEILQGRRERAARRAGMLRVFIHVFSHDVNSQRDITQSPTCKSSTISDNSSQNALVPYRRPKTLFYC